MDQKIKKDKKDPNLRRAIFSNISGNVKFKHNTFEEEYDDTTVNAICELIATGVPIDIAAKRLKLSLDEINRQRRAGKLYVEKGIDAPHHSIDMYLKVEEAKAAYFEALIRCVAQKAPTDWKAAITVLERRDPTNWGRNNFKTNLKLEGSQAKQYTQIIDAMNNNEISALEAAQLTDILMRGTKILELEDIKQQIATLKEMIEGTTKVSKDDIAEKAVNGG